MALFDVLDEARVGGLPAQEILGDGAKSCLPDGFAPRPGRPTLSYHASTKRWSRDDEGILLETVGRGQEFVLECDSYPGVLDWLAVFASVWQ